MSAELESLGRNVGRLLTELIRARSADLKETEERVTAELHVALEAFLPEAVKHELTRAVLDAWLGEPDQVILGTQDAEYVERVCRGLEAQKLPPVAELGIAEHFVGEIMGGAARLYLFFRASDGALKATEVHVAYPE